MSLSIADAYSSHPVLRSRMNKKRDHEVDQVGWAWKEMGCWAFMQINHRCILHNSCVLSCLPTAITPQHLQLYFKCLSAPFQYPPGQWAINSPNPGISPKGATQSPKPQLLSNPIQLFQKLSSEAASDLPKLHFQPICHSIKK